MLGIAYSASSFRSCAMRAIAIARRMAGGTTLTYWFRKKRDSAECEGFRVLSFATKDVGDERRKSGRCGRPLTSWISARAPRGTANRRKTHDVDHDLISFLSIRRKD